MYFFYLIGTIQWSRSTKRSSIQWSRPTKWSSIQWSRSSKWSKLNLIRRFWQFHIGNLVASYVSILVNICKTLLWIDISKEVTSNIELKQSCNPKFRIFNLKTNCSSRNIEILNNVFINVFILLDRLHPVKPPHQVKLHPVKPLLQVK
jgi:hypothetical protein